MVKKGRDFIKSDPAVMMGKPVITGTRVTVELILEKLAAGETVKQIIDEHYEVMLVNSNPATIMTNPGNTEELAVKGTFYVYKTDRGKRNSSEKERGMDAVIERNFGNFLWSSYK